jgi:UDP-N-acetylmuramoyl-tripeptide--D-alanyl-D-alanine ligase
VTLLDDAYNASPEAMKAALDVLAAMPGRRIAVLGDMFELGDHAEQGHADVGRHAVGRTDTLITVGELGRVIARAAVEAGMAPNSVLACASNEEAAGFLKARLRSGDFVLIKGSRGMRMESIVESLTGEPGTAGGHR